MNAEDSPMEALNLLQQVDLISGAEAVGGETDGSLLPTLFRGEDSWTVGAVDGSIVLVNEVGVGPIRQFGLHVGGVADFGAGVRLGGHYEDVVCQVQRLLRVHCYCVAGGGGDVKRLEVVARLALLAHNLNHGRAALVQVREMVAELLVAALGVQDGIVACRRAHHFFLVGIPLLLLVVLLELPEAGQEAAAREGGDKVLNVRNHELRADEVGVLHLHPPDGDVALVGATAVGLGEPRVALGRLKDGLIQRPALHGAAQHLRVHRQGLPVLCQLHGAHLLEHEEAWLAQHGEGLVHLLVVQVFGAQQLLVVHQAKLSQVRQVVHELLGGHVGLVVVEVRVAVALVLRLVRVVVVLRLRPNAAEQQ
mmetsp:Transcript_11088/g.40642  ORF Transcript_11088/g.40642 Transcript_11088/m.40642 type:complete len:365 (-) Transcript_11088:257-1351(-)